MKKNLLRYWKLNLVMVLLLQACAGLQPEVTVSPGGGEKVLEIRASSFKFEPNNIKAFTGDVILLNIENISGSSHNFTIKGPEGSVLQSVELPAGKITSVSITFSEKGIYDFYCDKSFHSSFGMKGRIEVVER